MAATYSELKAEIQRWLDNDNGNLVSAIPEFIRDAEARFNRTLRCSEQECQTNAPLNPASGSTTDTIGVYRMPTDCAALRDLYIDSDYLHIFYWRNIPALSGANTTNWLLTKHPDLYRFQALNAAESFLKDDPRIGLWAEKAQAIFHELDASDTARRYDGSSLVTRTPDNRPWTNRGTQNGRRLSYLPLWDFSELELSGCSTARARYYTIAADKIRIWPKPACTDAST